jgi:hypothetical protein
MPTMENITFSHEACISAIRGYYKFLTELYLDETFVVEPPVDGWPTITTDNFKDLGKTNEIIFLLRHLPYIRKPVEPDDPQAAPWCYFADWSKDGQHLIDGKATAEDLRVMSEPPGYSEEMPAHVIGLTSGGRENPSFLLDVEQGAIYWYECPGEIVSNPSREQVQGEDPYGYAPDNEAEWRSDSACWAVEDFFEVLKDQFRQLMFLPTSSRRVIDVYTRLGSHEGKKSLLQRIYQEHGWPDLDRYDKRNCLAAVQKALDEHYP